MKNDKYIPALSFDFLSAYYDQVIKKVMPEGFRDMLIQKAGILPNETILDFGTGTAEAAILIKKQIPTTTVTGLDVDQKILNIAERKIKNKNLHIQLVAYNGNDFPFNDNCFDKVVSCLVLHHLSPDNKRKVFSEIFRVLKTGGKIYIADWGLERNKIKAKLLNYFKYFNVLKYIVEQGKGMLPQYILNAGFKNVIETGYLKTRTGTLCYYKAEK